MPQADPVTELLPSTRLGFISPLDVIDTFPYEFYRLAPPGVIASMISIGLRGFSEQAATSALDEGLLRCEQELIKRRVQVMFLSGIPLVLPLGIDYSKQFAQHCRDAYGVVGTTSIDACVAAIRALGAQKVVIADKWDATMNELFVSALRHEGINVGGWVSEPHDAATVKEEYEAGVEVALRVAERALAQVPDADCLVLAGGAWLVGPFVPLIEKRLGVPVVANHQSKVWHALSLAGCPTTDDRFGALMGLSVNRE